MKKSHQVTEKRIIAIRCHSHRLLNHRQRLAQVLLSNDVIILPPLHPFEYLLVLNESLLLLSHQALYFPRAQSLIVISSQVIAIEHCCCRI
jgi:hypothetical protein